MQELLLRFILKFSFARLISPCRNSEGDYNKGLEAFDAFMSSQESLRGCQCLPNCEEVAYETQVISGMSIFLVKLSILHKSKENYFADIIFELGRGETVHDEKGYGLGGALRHARLADDQQPPGN